MNLAARFLALLFLGRRNHLELGRRYEYRRSSGPAPLMFGAVLEMMMLFFVCFARECQMNIRNTLVFLFSGFIAVLFVLTCHAHEESHSPLEQANLEKAIYCMEILESRNDLEPSQRIDILRNECYSEGFVEHSPHISGGREGLFKLFQSRYEEYPKLSMSIKRSASEGDLVWLHAHVKRTPNSLGAALIHIFRMKDGMIVEHWGVGQPVPEDPKNENTMF